MSLGKRGPLKKAGANNVKASYKCLVPECTKEIRGDELKSHYTSKVDFELLSTLKSVSSELALARICSGKNDEKNHHTRYFFEKEWFTIEQIPSYKNHKTSVTPIKSPFIQCSEAKKRKIENQNNQVATNTISGETTAQINSYVTTSQSERDEETTDISIDENNESHNSHTDHAPQCSLNAETICDDPDPSLDNSDFNLDSLTFETNTEGHAANENETSLHTEPTIESSSDLLAESHVGTKTDTNFKETITSMLQQLVNGEILKDETEQLTNFLSSKIAIKLHELSGEKSLEQEPTAEWMVGDHFDVCKPCLKHSNSPDVPQALKHNRRGNYGLVANDQRSNNLHKAKVSHENNPLHIFCANKEKESEKTATQQEIESTQAGEMIIRNALLCFIKGWSAEDFLSLNDKDNLTQNIKAATKNDSSAEFFKIRFIAFDKLTEKMKKLFCEIESFSITLDKVTTNRCSYTVLLTYFFHNGEICCYLNKLIKLETTDYDSKGTARMVVECLRETTGLSKLQQARKLRHVAYDGVYADQEERVKGGGSLSLRKHLALELGVDDEEITGKWDQAHLMQLCFKDVMCDHPEIMEVMNILFEAMKQYHTGKAGAHFNDVAKGLGNIILTQKQYQSTRFVRSFLRGGTSGIRNLPTLVHITAVEYEACQKACDNTRGKELNKQLNKLRSTEFIMKLLGIIQILEIYSEASLAVQHSFWFPTEILDKIDDAKSALNALSENWSWEEDFLPLANIGSPAGHIENLKKGIFCPYVPKESVRKNMSNPKVSEKLKKQNVNKLSFNQLFEDEPELEFAGKIESLEGDFQLIEPKVTKMLQDICKSILSHWNERDSCSNLDSVNREVLGFPHDLSTMSHLESIVYMKSNLDKLIKALPQNQSELYDSSTAAPGFVSWNNFWWSKEKFQMHKVYKMWHQNLDDDKRSSFKMFIDLFENLQIRIMSEAMAETVGSMMNMHSGKGRYLQPANFSMELYLQFNLGPLHLLDYFIKDIQDTMSKAYMRKSDKNRLDKVVSEDSAANHSYKKRAEDKAKLPLSLWKS